MNVSFPRIRAPGCQLIPSQDYVRGQKLAVLMEVQSLSEVQQCCGSSGLSKAEALPSGWKEVPSLLDNPLLSARIGAEELTAILSWPCVLSIDEDSEMQAL